MNPVLAPFDTWPAQVVDAQTQLSAWYVQPRIVVIHYHDERYSLASAQRAVTLIDGVLQARADEVAQHHGLVIIHDCRRITTIDKEAQHHLDREWKKLTPADVGAGYLVVDPKIMNVFTRMVVHSINIVATFRTGKMMSLVTDPLEPILRHRIVPPGVGQIFPRT